MSDQQPLWRPDAGSRPEPYRTSSTPPAQPDRQPGQQWVQQPQQPSWTPAARPDSGPFAPLPPTARPAHNPVLGWVGALVVLVPGIALGVVAHHAGRVFGQLVRANGRDVDDIDRLRTLHPDWFRAFQHDALLATVLCAVGLAGWVVCIIATVRGSARVVSITGIVLGVLAVVVSLVVFTLTLVPYIPQA